MAGTRVEDGDITAAERAKLGRASGVRAPRPPRAPHPATPPGAPRERKVERMEREKVEWERRERARSADPPEPAPPQEAGPHPAQTEVREAVAGPRPPRWLQVGLVALAVPIALTRLALTGVGRGGRWLRARWRDRNRPAPTREAPV